jgi:hypothetical protein
MVEFFAQFWVVLGGAAYIGLVILFVLSMFDGGD